MSMHLVGPYLTTTKYNSKQKKSNSARKVVSDAKHNEWLVKQGLTSNQIKMKKAFLGNVRHNNEPDFRITNPYELSNGVGNGFKKGIMENLHKESPAVQKEIMAKAARTTMAYNKGPSMYFSPDADTTNIGTQSRRG
jgi:hypothetical protein